MITPAPSYIQAAIEAACAAEEVCKFQVVREEETCASTRSYQEAYRQALILARRSGQTIAFQYNGIECFATPEDPWQYAA